MSEDNTVNTETTKIPEKKEHDFGTILATIGSILVASGIAWFIATNWHQIPGFLKIIILLIATSLAYILGTLLRTHDHQGVGGALIILGGLLYTLSIFLIAQIFNLNESLQMVSFLFLISWVGVISASYLFDSSGSLLVGLAEFLIWLGVQYFAFAKLFFRGDFSLGGLILAFLAAGILFYGLNLLHKSRDHKFSEVYQWWTAFYFLLFAYILSFQSLIGLLWPSGFSLGAGPLTFLTIFFITALAIFIFGIVAALSKQQITGKEIIIFVGILLLFAIMILSSNVVSSSLGSCRTESCFSFNAENECNAASSINCVWIENRCATQSCSNYGNQTSCENDAPSNLECRWQSSANREYCTGNFVRISSDQNQICNQYDNKRSACLDQNVCKWSTSYSVLGRGGNAPFSLWALWIGSNIIFILLILTVIGYGTAHGLPRLVNLGIAFFSLEIITRYLGFILDFWGYTSLSIIFISGGIILILGGWLINKWRKSLIEKAKTASNISG